MIELKRATAEHADAIARITYDAFAEVSHRHGFEPEIANPEMGRHLVQMFIGRPDIHGVVAIDGGQVIGHNFVQLTDAVAGVGPICVDPKRQCKGVGRELMKHIVDYSIKNHGPQVRLVQEAFNMASLSLYASLGFDVTEPLVLMSVPTMSEATCRPLAAADVDAADALCKATQNVSRRNELTAMIAMGPSMGCVPHGRFRDGRLSGFCVPGFFGFGAGQTADDLLLTSRVAVAALPPPLQRILLPARNGDLFRAALSQGFRSIKVMQLMAMGPYQSPSGFWAPSIAY